MQAWPFRKIHICWLIAAWCLGVVIGVILVAKVPVGIFYGWQWLGLGLILLIPLWKIRYNWLIVLMMLSGIIIGLWRGSFDQVELTNYQQIIGETVVLKGKVLEDPDIDKRGQTVLRLGHIEHQQHLFSGSIWVTIEKNDVIRRSDVVTLEGKLAEGFGGFAATMYRATIVDVKRQVPGDVAVDIRDWFSERVRSQMPETEAALGLGYLLGLRRALPMDLMEALQIAGLTHVIVASGYNLTILVRLSRRLFIRISKYLATLSSTAMIISFIAVSGMSPSMSRAGLVAGLSLAAWYYGRKIHPFVLLPLAASITLLVNPSYGWNDLGWQLSFAAFTGVIVLAPLLQRYFFGDKEPGTIRQILGETVSAQLMTLPLLLVAFGVMSNVAIIANLLVLPLVPLAMLLTFLVGLLSSVSLLGEFVAMLTTSLLKYMTFVADWLAGQSWAQTEVNFGWWAVLGFYTLMAVAVWWMQRQTKFELRKANIIE